MTSLRNGVCGLLIVVMLSGCTMPNGYYQPATVADSVICNPCVGWNGYTVNVPEGFSVFNPVEEGLDLSKLTAIQKWCLEDDKAYSRALSIDYTERFLLEDFQGRGFICFVSDTIYMGSSWSSRLSVEQDRLLQRMINKKLVQINDTKAQNSIVTIAGQRGWYIRGTQRGYFQNKDHIYAYEGYLILGKLKEMFWIEGLAHPAHRKFLRENTRKVAESLVIK